MSPVNTLKGARPLGWGMAKPAGAGWGVAKADWVLNVPWPQEQGSVGSAKHYTACLISSRLIGCSVAAVLALRLSVAPNRAMLINRDMSECS